MNLGYYAQIKTDYKNFYNKLHPLCNPGGHFFLWRISLLIIGFSMVEWEKMINVG